MTLRTYDPDGNLCLFTVYRNADERKLNTWNGHADNEWNPDNRFVFLRSRNSHYFKTTTNVVVLLYVCL
jgi:hypothetical protein